MFVLSVLDNHGDVIKFMLCPFRQVCKHFIIIFFFPEMLPTGSAKFRLGKRKALMFPGNKGLIITIYLQSLLLFNIICSAFHSLFCCHYSVNLIPIYYTLFISCFSPLLFFLTVNVNYNFPNPSLISHLLPYASYIFFTSVSHRLPLTHSLKEKREVILHEFIFLLITICIHSSTDQCPSFTHSFIITIFSLYFRLVSINSQTLIHHNIQGIRDE